MSENSYWKALVELESNVMRLSSMLKTKLTSSKALPLK